ncbi:hypothetical protein K431DRAFT_89337 [Polychaeton citri CBS 116435]|uniref:Uncharacterized protein n=1 Tax=Polychaeton citri CBS 116435 TaxID=1314669 RepID=A0A9P4Q671_9PEZI|nr:hypothetical protein K431DRAFT_89337 [Polychaeton citri CBS 116435]
MVTLVRDIEQPCDGDAAFRIQPAHCIQSRSRRTSNGIEQIPRYLFKASRRTRTFHSARVSKLKRIGSWYDLAARQDTETKRSASAHASGTYSTQCNGESMIWRIERGSNTRNPPVCAASVRGYVHPRFPQKRSTKEDGRMPLPARRAAAG